MTRRSRTEIQAAWTRTMNMPPEVLLDWLSTPASASVGTRAPGAHFSVGQLAGLASVDLLEVPLEKWTDADVKHAARTLGYVRRHRAQFPAGDVTDSRWRRSLRNWGHDPLWEDRLVLPDPEGGLLVDDRVVGHLSAHQEIDGLEVEEMRIEEEWRERGLATAVLHALARRARGGLHVTLLGEETAARSFFLARRFTVLADSGDAVELTRS